MSTLVDLLNNVAQLFALVFVYRFIAEHWANRESVRRIAMGFLFGTVAIVAMSNSIAFAPGIIFDARTAVLSLAGMFGGATVAFIAGVIAASWRIYLGGAGMAVGLATIVTAVVLGLMFRRHYRHRLATIKLSALLKVGLIVNLATMVWFAFLPLTFVEDILLRLALPYIVLLTLATLLLGVLLREIERIRHFDSLLGESQERFRLLLDTSTVSIWEEDLSGVLAILDRLRDEGVTDLREYLRSDPQQLSALLSAVKVFHVNPASLKLFGARSEQELARDIRKVFGPGALDTFTNGLCAIWDRKPRFVGEAALQTLQGVRIDCLIAMPVPHTESAARHVPVSIIDISSQKQVEAALAAGRRRLQEIIWGTDVGTWEWNVQTGETVFNERWAEMIGYTLAELAPITIKTWERLTHPDDLAGSDAQLQKVFSRELDHYQCEARMRHKDGRWIWVLDRGNVVEWTADGKPLRMSGTHTDISRRKEAELRSERLIRLRDTMLQCHSLMLTEKDENTLMQKMVDVLVTNHNYLLGWIGIPIEQDGVRIVKPVARAGSAISYLDQITVHWSDDEYSQGPTGMAVRTGQTRILQIMEGTQTFRPWIDAARKAGFKSSIALPIPGPDGVIAVVTVYSTVENGFDDDEVSILTEFTNNLGFAIQSLRTEREKDRIQTELNRAALGAVNAIAATIEKRDPYTSGHQHRVAALSVAIARAAGWDDTRIEGLRLAATIHDIGKIYVPAEILNRPGKLSSSEFEIIKSHPQVGYEILQDTHFPWPIREMIVQHHERLDGSGYPRGLTGDAILEEARIIAIADVAEAISSHRPYRPAWGINQAMQELRDGRGSLYDARYVDICIDLIEKQHFNWQ